MNKEIKTTIINTFGTISYLVVIFFFITLILFTHNNVNDALKESWTASLSFMSVLSTLGAAYIASKLFNDWKIQQNHSTQKEFIHDINNQYKDIVSYVTENVENMHKMVSIYNSQLQNLPSKHTSFIMDLFRLHHGFTIRLMNLKIEVQNYGIIINDIEYSKDIIAEIDKAENILESLFNPIKQLSETHSSHFSLAIYEYNKYMSEELSSNVYETVIIPLLNKLPAK